MTFRDCKNLSSITIPEGVTSIGNEAFRNCSSLTSFTIPDGVTSIGDSTFYNCSRLSSLTIPESVRSIERGAFAICSGLTQITVQAVTPPMIGDSAFSSVGRDIPVYVPAESLEAYQNADVWKEFNLQGMDSKPASVLSQP